MTHGRFSHILVGVLVKQTSHGINPSLVRSCNIAFVATKCTIPSIFDSPFALFWNFFRKQTLKTFGKSKSNKICNTLLSLDYPALEYSPILPECFLVTAKLDFTPTSTFKRGIDSGHSWFLLVSVVFLLWGK